MRQQWEEKTSETDSWRSGHLHQASVCYQFAVKRNRVGHYMQSVFDKYGGNYKSVAVYIHRNLQKQKSRLTTYI